MKLGGGFPKLGQELVRFYYQNSIVMFQMLCHNWNSVTSFFYSLFSDFNFSKMATITASHIFGYWL